MQLPTIWWVGVNELKMLHFTYFTRHVLVLQSGNGNDRLNHRNPSAGCAQWGNKTSSADFNGNSDNLTSFYATQGWDYEYNPNTRLPPTMEFPAVPYGPTDFHCERILSSWSDPLTLNAGWLVGLSDLNTEKDSVQQRIADYMTDLISM